MDFDLRVIDHHYGWTHSVLAALDRSRTELAELAAADTDPSFDGISAQEEWEYSTGVALVALQVYLSASSSRMKLIEPTCPDAAVLRRTHGAATVAVDVTDVEAFWQLGNLFKHEDEWRSRATDAGRNIALDHWSESRDKKTIATLRSLGLDPGTEFPLITGVSCVLGETWEFTALLGRAEAWRGRCLRALGIAEA